MRGDKLKSLLKNWKFDVIDTDIPFYRLNRLVRSIGFRYQAGPAIRAVNSFIAEHLTESHYDLIWVDKAILITKEITKILRAKGIKLVHYTPDTAFFGNRSKRFYDSIDLYDFLVTTKSFEIEDYRQKVSDSKIIVTTQGFDGVVHKPVNSFKEKVYRVAFVGLCEPAREKIIQYLIDNESTVVVAGFKWDAFQRKNEKNKYFGYSGRSLWNTAYTSLLSSSFFSLGLVSKRFPELHTTRTFEIPACGTALVTERNPETSSFFSERDAIFYSDPAELVAKIRYYRDHPAELREITENGTKLVNNHGFEYASILGRILDQVL